MAEYMGPARDTVEMGSIEVKLNDIPEGKSVTFKWRGKPLFVRHREASEIAREQSVGLAELRDPQQDSVGSTVTWISTFLDNRHRECQQLPVENTKHMLTYCDF